MMDGMKCKEYLQIVLAMESEIYKRERLVSSLEQTIDSLGIPKEIKRP